MARQLQGAVVALVLLTLITGVIYPAVVTVAGQVIFPAQANGSLRTNAEGSTVGSELIGQVIYTLDENGAISNLDEIAPYFWNRPSATGYATLPSSGANYSQTDVRLQELVAQRAAAFSQANGIEEDVALPLDVLYASGSGLDPHISPAAAQLQINRVAEARGLTVEEVTALVNQYTEGRQLGILGEPRVNVLRLNLALDGVQ